MVDIKERPIETNTFPKMLSKSKEKISEISFGSSKDHYMKRSRPMDLEWICKATKYKIEMLYIGHLAGSERRTCQHMYTVQIKEP